MITVGELISLLEQFDRDSQILMYDNLGESCTEVVGVEIQHREDKYYTKGDSPLDYEYKDLTSIPTIIGGNAPRKRTEYVKRLLNEIED